VTSVDAVLALALSLPCTSEHLVQDRVTFRVGRLVYVAFSRDERFMGFGYPQEERDALIAWSMVVPAFLVRQRLLR
jgi:hypothetical protein